MAVAAVVGAAAAAMTALDGRRLAVCFLRWARDTDRAKVEAAATAAEAALAAADREAKREREAWESLQATLEGSAAAREREAREAAEEAGRKVRVRPAVNQAPFFLAVVVLWERYALVDLCMQQLLNRPRVPAKPARRALTFGVEVLPDRPTSAKRGGDVLGESHHGWAAVLF